MDGNCLRKQNTFDPALEEQLCSGKYFTRTKASTVPNTLNIAGYAGFNSEYYSNLTSKGLIKKESSQGAVSYVINLRVLLISLRLIQRQGPRSNFTQSSMQLELMNIFSSEASKH